MPKFSQWPYWLQLAVVVPHALLGFVATVFWWPKSSHEWGKFAIVAAYLIAFYLVLHYIFAA